MRSKNVLIVVSLLTLGFVVGRLSVTPSLAASGTLDSPAPPGSTFSYTLEDIYNRLNDGTAGTQSAFTEPTSGPTTGTGYDLTEIMAIAPAADNTNGAIPAEVVAGKTFWGLNEADYSWGTLTGTMPDRGAVIYTPGTSNQTVAAGYHSGAGYVAGDVDLAAGNIISDVKVFGVTGTYPMAPVPKTGQTTSDDNKDDGELERGVAWPSPRFTDNGDGTVTDNLTGLIWLKNANCYGSRIWSTALSDANTLNSGECGLSDGSAEGDWRLPNRRELHSLVDSDYAYPALPSVHPFTTVQSDYYWSSTTFLTNSFDAWGVHLGDARVINDPKASTYYVWPIRGGQ